jgi:hypothetical protein
VLSAREDGDVFTFALNHVGGLLLRWWRDQFAAVEVETPAGAARTLTG